MKNGLRSWRKSADQGLYVLLVTACLGVMAYAQVWQHKPVIDWDTTLYYSYLPAIFIYGDLQFEPERNEEWKKRHFFRNTDGEGNEYMKMTAGLAVLYSPFFGLAHLGALLSEATPADGFSAPYRLGLLASSLFFVLWGLHFLRLILRRFFDPWPAGLAVAGIFAGTNLPYYSLVEPMSHGYSFFLVCTLYWSYLKFRDRPQASWGLLFGLLAGLIIWIRPTNVVALLLPALHALLAPGLPWNKLLRALGLSILMAFITVLPQLFYWHEVTGNWLVYSYNEQGFFWSDPEIWKGWFSYRKGWLTYAPILWLALPGWLVLLRKYPRCGGLGLAVLGLASYLTFSWWSWWYGGGYGARPMIEYLPLMALALAALFQYLSQQNLIWRWSIFALGLYLVAWSVFMNKQYYSGIIHYDGMNKELFWRQFWKDHYVQDWNELVQRPDYEKALRNED